MHTHWSLQTPYQVCFSHFQWRAVHIFFIFNCTLYDFSQYLPFAETQVVLFLCPLHNLSHGSVNISTQSSFLRKNKPMFSTHLEISYCTSWYLLDSSQFIHLSPIAFLRKYTELYKSSSIQNHIYLAYPIFAKISWNVPFHFWRSIISLS